MVDRHFDPLNDLDNRLRAAAAASRPQFSPELHERILAAIDSSEMLPVLPWTTRLRRPLAIAASLLVLVTGAALAGYSLTEMVRNERQNAARTVAAAPSGENGPASPAHDAQWMQRALVAADHLGWLDDDSRSAAAWIVADLAADSEPADEEAEPAQGS